jgi:hypothetical protein
MKTFSVRIIKKNIQHSKNTSEDFLPGKKSSVVRKISNNVKSWVDDLRERKNLERAKSFNLLAEVTR